MTKLFIKLQNLFQNEEGQGMVEYGLILALIAVVVIAALGFLGGEINSIFEGITEELGS